MLKAFFLSLSVIGLTYLSTPFSVASETVTAWGTPKIEHHALGFNVTGAEIILQGAPKPVQTGVWNKFEFHGVPTGVPCQLTIRIKSPTTGETVEYRASYKFHKAPVLAGFRGRRASGYMGDFLYDLSANRIRYTSRY